MRPTRDNLTSEVVPSAPAPGNGTAPGSGKTDGRPPTRGADGPIDAYLSRFAAYLASESPGDGGWTRSMWPHPEDRLDNDSVDLIRESREERTAHLERVGGWHGYDGPSPAPRGTDEPLMDYVERVGAYVMGNEGEFDEDSAKLILRARRERTLEVMRAIEEAPAG